jgi:hypothetical protein
MHLPQHPQTLGAPWNFVGEKFNFGILSQFFNSLDLFANAFSQD